MAASSALNTLEYNLELCIGCGMCTQVCPHGVFLMKDKRASVTDKDLCMECGACALNCEVGAIKVRAGVGCAAGVLAGLASGGPPECGCSTSPTSCA